MPVTAMLQELRHNITVMGEMIENAVDTALMALIDRNLDLAQEVIASDCEIDEMENVIDQKCHEILRHTATRPDDFRFVVAAMKICVDLERMADQAVDVARSVSFLVNRSPVLDDLSTFTTIVETAEQMVRDSVSCLIDGNASLAWSICLADDVVDGETQRLHDFLISVAQDAPEKIERAVHLLYIVHALERIADQATNTAEEVIFMLEGKIVRHHIEDHRREIAEERRRKAGKKARTVASERASSRLTTDPNDRGPTLPETDSTPATRKLSQRRKKDD